MADTSGLERHFEGFKDKSQGSRWDEYWKSGEPRHWDRGGASPALQDYIHSSDSVLSKIGSSGERLRVLVPGCGTGYDPTMLATEGFQVEGLDVSDQAAKEAVAYAQTKKDGEQSNQSDGAVHFKSAGSVEFLVGDFFDSEWRQPESGGIKRAGQYDMIYDYTFLCALPPPLRKSWADRMAELVKPGRYLVCLEFPRWKNLSAAGPPYGVKGVHWDLLAAGGDGVLKSGDEEKMSESSGGKFERVQYFAPPRTFESGQGTDMMSVWRRK